jgi:predicted acetyltransferase
VGAAEASDMSHLTKPSRKYKDSYLRGIQEMDENQQSLHYKDLKPPELDELEEGEASSQTVENLPPHKDELFWLVDEGEFIGRVYLIYTLTEAHMRAGQVDYFIRPSKRRQGYGKEILHLALDKFREQGLKRILISCASDNIGSRKIIEANGGVFENEISSWDAYGSSGIRRRYWIDL